LDGLEGTAAADRLLPLDRLLPELPVLVLGDEMIERARHGNDLPVDLLGSPNEAPPAAVRLVDGGGRLLGIAEPGRLPGVLHPAVVVV
jgi:hypothetical protein